RGLPEARRRAGRARRPVSAQYAPLRDRLLRRAEGGRNSRQYFPLESLRGLEFKIEDSETDILVTLDLASLYPQAEKLLTTTRLKRLIVGEFAEWALAPDPVKAHMKAGGMLSEPKYGERLLAFRDLIDNDGGFQAHPLGDLTDALAVIQYT